MNYIVTRRAHEFRKIGKYNYIVDLEDMELPMELAVDSETTSLKTWEGEMFSLQIGTRTNNYLIDLESIPFSDVIPYLEGKELVFHNASFDLGWMYKHNFFPKKVRDTFLASKIIYNGLNEMRHGFGYVMEREMNLNYDKSEQQNIARIKLSTDKAIQYCFNDVDRLLDLHDVLSEKIDEGGYREAYDLHCRWIRALAYMEQCGMPLSPEKWKAKMESDKREIRQKERIIIDYIYDKFPKYRDGQIDMFCPDKRILLNLASPKQMIPVFKALEINVIDPEGKESIKEDVISKTKHEFVKMWTDYKGFFKETTTYGENILDHLHEGRLRASFVPILDTARISTRRGEPPLLTFPKGEKTRTCFEAKDGFVVIVSDYDGQETRTGADITEDKAMIDSIVNGSCLHCAFVRVLNPELAHLSDDEIKKDHADKRQAAKAPRFCFQFGGAAFTLHQNEGLPMEECVKIEKAYKELHSGIYTYGEEKLKEVLALGYIESTAGFKLHIPHFDEFKKEYEWMASLSRDFWDMYKIGKREYAKLKEDPEYKSKKVQSLELYRNNAYRISQCAKKKAEIFKLILNNPTQQRAALQTKEATARIFEHIEARGHFWKARIAGAVHDEIILETTEELGEEYREVLERSMIEGGNKYLEKGLFEMACEAHIGKDWESAKKGK